MWRSRAVGFFCPLIPRPEELSERSSVFIIGGGSPGREVRGFHVVLRKLANLPEHLQDLLLSLFLSLRPAVDVELVDISHLL